MSSKKNIALVAVTAVALSLGTVGVASADSKGKSVKSVTSSVPGKSAGVANPMAGGMAGKSGDDDNHGLRQEADFKVVLSALVTKGTITQVQADAVLAALIAARPAAPVKSTPQTQAERDAHRLAQEAVVATTLGLTTDAIKARLTAGESLATIAGVKKDALIAALIAFETKEIDARVTATKITAAQATTLKAGLTAQVTEAVNKVGVKGMGPKGSEGKGHGKNH